MDTQSYFDRDCLWIVDKVQSDPKHIPNVAAFVLLSIRQPFYMVPRMMRDVALSGLTSKFLFGKKREGLAYATEHATELWNHARACYSGREPLDDLIIAYMAVPSLGLAKASFMAQLTVGQGACLDQNNLRALGLPEERFKTPKSLLACTLRRHVAEYNATWQAVGTSAYWWNSWCDFVGTRTLDAKGAHIPGFASGAEVSAVHRVCIATA